MMTVYSALLVVASFVCLIVAVGITGSRRGTSHPLWNLAPVLYLLVFVFGFSAMFKEHPTPTTREYITDTECQARLDAQVAECKKLKNTPR